MELNKDNVFLEIKFQTWDGKENLVYFISKAIKKHED